MFEIQKTRNPNELIILSGEFSGYVLLMVRSFMKCQDDQVTCVYMLNICHEIASFATYYYGRGYSRYVGKPSDKCEYVITRHENT